jgi:DnaK suppressor protein
MDENTLMIFNDILVERLQKLQPGWRDQVSAVQNEGPVDPMDDADLAFERSQKEFYLTMRQHNSRTVREILEALHRLVAGLYGICDECGTHIDLGRLKAQPTASVCIECKKELEAEERKSFQTC